MGKVSKNSRPCSLSLHLRAERAFFVKAFAVYFQVVRQFGRLLGLGFQVGKVLHNMLPYKIRVKIHPQFLQIYIMGSPIITSIVFVVNEQQRTF